MNSLWGKEVGLMPDSTLSTESPLAIHYTEFTVFNKDTTLLDTISELKAELERVKALEAGMKTEPTMRDLVEDCRKKNGR